MGKESVQIRKHIEEEKARLDSNLAALESRFTETKDTLLRWSKSPGLLVALAFTAGLILADFTSQRSHAR